MKWIKLTTIFLSVVILSACEFSFNPNSSLTSSHITSDTTSMESSESSELSVTSLPSSEEPGITPYDIYLLATASGYQGTYDDWLNSIQGSDGRHVELMVDLEYIYWRYSTESNWTVLIDLGSLKGQPGITGENGLNGLTPYIGLDGNWWLGNDNLGIPTKGVTGEDGIVPHIGANNNWWIGNTDTGISAIGLVGRSAYDVYISMHPTYEGSEATWLSELLTGGLSNETHTVTFDSNGGTSIDAQIVKSGLLARRPNAPTKPGHQFVDWYLDGERWVFIGFAVTENITLTARWEPIVLLINYELNGGSNHPNNPINYISGVTITLQAATRLGFDFAGWYLDDAFMQLITTISTDFDTNLTLHAKWIPQTGVTITYVLNGGTNPSSNLTFVKSDLSSFILAEANKNDYIFGGWYDDETFTNKITSINPSLLIDDITLYAKWNPINETPPFANFVTWDFSADFVRFTDGSSSKIRGYLRIIPRQSGYHHISTDDAGAQKEGALYNANGELLVSVRGNSNYGYGIVIRAYLRSGVTYYLESSNVDRYATNGWQVFVREDGLEAFNPSAPLLLDVANITNEFSISKVAKHYRFTPNVSGYYRLTATGDAPTEISMYNHKKELITFDQNSGLDNHFMIHIYLFAGIDYYFMTSFETAAAIGSYTTYINLES